MTEEKAIEIMKEWIEYEKANKNKINKADELIEVQETMVKALEKKNKIIDVIAGYIATLDIEEDICSKTQNEHCDKMNFGECEDCIKQYFEKKVDKEQ